jgi:hypothetical protein
MTMNNEFGKDIEGSKHGLILSIIQTFTWMNQEKPLKPQSG